MKIKSKKTLSKKKLTLLFLPLIIFAGLGTWYFFGQSKPDDAPEEPVINMTKTDNEKQHEQQLQTNPTKKMENQSDTPDQPPIDASNNKQSVSAIITGSGMYDGKVEVRGFVSNSVEQSGTCQYTFIKSNEVIRKETSVLTNPTSTTCKTLVFDANELSSGTWLVSLQYTSDISYGKSDAQELLIP